MLPTLLLGEAQRVEAFRNLLRYLSLSLDENPATTVPALTNVYLISQPTEISLF